MKWVSVIIPVLNRDIHLDKCVKSVLSQTYSDLEILLINYLPAKDALLLSDAYKANSRIKIISAAGYVSVNDSAGLLMTGIQQAKGEYVLFVNGSDWILDTMTKSLVACAENYRSDVVLCGYYCIKDERSLLNHFSDRDISLTKKELISFLHDETGIRNHLFNKLWRRELFTALHNTQRNIDFIALTYQALNEAVRITLTSYIGYFFTGTRERIFIEAFERKKFWEPVLSDYRSVLLYDTFISAREILLQTKAHTLGFAKRAVFIKEAKTCIRKCAGYLNNENIISHELKRSSLFLANFRILYKGYKFFGNHFPYIRSCLKIPFFLRYLINCATIKIKEPEEHPHPDIYLIGTPGHKNLGDHAITQATIEYFRNIAPKCKMIEVPESSFHEWIIHSKNTFYANDLIIFQGGGNIGDLYPFVDEIRNLGLRYFLKLRKIILPQTIYISDSKEGNRKRKQLSKLYKRLEHIHYFARDEASCNQFNCLGLTEKASLCADMVLHLHTDRHNGKRKGALLCLRSDTEGILRTEELLYILTLVQKEYAQVLISDTCSPVNIGQDKRERLLKEKLSIFCTREMVITDRLHGMLFAVITNTPCIVLPNFNHKVSGVYEMIKPYANVLFINKLDELPKALAHGKQENTGTDFHQIDTLFIPLTTVVSEYYQTVNEKDNFSGS